MNKEDILKKAQAERKENNDSDYITYIDRKAKTLSSSIICIFLGLIYLFPSLVGVNSKEMIHFFGYIMPFTTFCVLIGMLMAFIQYTYLIIIYEKLLNYYLSSFSQ